MRLLILFSVFSACILYLTSCTISFQNISTHGTANDLVDENQAVSPRIKPVITVPLSTTM